ncbi:MAG: sigma-54-dependent Fis family transcriptional regulator [Deltaproteobacteria bacterium]|nr:sigma-54-dependent Fis family transcriptional regulator [Deltaproteobacteria bacterium]
MEKILVIDDESIIRESMTAYLEDSGCVVCQARDGREGLAVFRTEKPDLVVVDLRMPGIDGLEVLSTVIAESPDTPTLVVSGTGVIQDAIEALRMGALDFITKPILDMAVLEHAAKTALERARLRVENRRYREHLEEEIRCRTIDLVERTRALQESEAKLSAIIELFEGLIYTSTRDHRIEFMNRKLMDHIGRDATGEKCHAALFDLTSTCPWCVNTQVFKGETTRWETRNPRDNRWYYGINTPIFGPDGQVLKVQSIALDITDRKEAEEAMREREVRLREENTRLRSSLKGSGQFGRIIGKSAAMQKVYETILKAAQADAGVIIYGESGTGKELVAKTIHELSDRSPGPFVTVNCGAIPDTLIESEFFGYRKGAFTGAATDKPGFLDSAHGGTLFLDEVGEIPLSLQVKLLRAIEGGGYTPVGGDKLVKTDFRVVAATHRDLRERVEQQKMRQDFYYRIHLIPLFMPPLRQRKEDLPLLVHHFLNTLGHGNSLHALPESVMREIQCYNWPGNVRELQNVIHRYVTLREIDLPLAPDTPHAHEIASSMPPFRNNPLASLAEALNDAEKSVIVQSLQAHQWKRGRVAQILGIDRRTLFRKMKLHGLL